MGKTNRGSFGMVIPVYRLMKFSRWNPTHIHARGHLQVKTHYLLLKRGQPGRIHVSWLCGREPSGIAYPTRNSVDRKGVRRRSLVLDPD
jgi:hypothetical protein